MIPGSANPLLLASAAAGGYQVQRSLRFNSSDSGFCSRTPGTASNRKTWTWAGWVKRTVKNTATDQMLFTGGTTNSDTGFLALDFTSSDKLRLSSAVTNFLITTAVYRDPGAWMHIVFAFDATQGTNANKVKLYVNSTEVTVFDTDGRSSISNQDYGVNQAAAHEIGRASLGSNKYLDGYLADIHFIDGQALTPSSFTEVSATTGQLIPLAYSGSYGTNGFKLKFSDNSAATAATLGADTSGNGNNWTPNNLSVTAGAGNDSLVDTPTSYGTDTGVGNEVRGNYATLNPLDKGSNINAPTNGNLDVTTQSSGYGAIRATIGISSGKWYWEFTANSSDASTGLCSKSSNVSTYMSNSPTGYVYISNGFTGNNESYVNTGTTYTTNDLIGVAFNADTGTLNFYKNNSLVSSATFTGISSSNAPYFPVHDDHFGSASSNGTYNFGQRAFAYTAPSGFKALCDTNLGTPVVAKPNTLFDTILYSGNNSTQSITSLAFNPDMVWSKCRNVGRSHRLSDAIRGSNVDLYTDTTASDNFYGTGSITAFTANGFNLDNSASSQYNTSGETYVSWCWDAGTSTVSNTAGSITSQVRANASAGFSVVTWNGNGNATIGHGLGVAPQFIICKKRTGTSDWQVGHNSLGWTKRLGLNLTTAEETTISAWNNTSPTSTVFSIGNTSNFGGDIVAYCFAPVVGYSSFGSYTGNGSTDGPFVYTGMRPRWVMIKRSDSASLSYGWFILDTARNTYNVMNTWLAADNSAADGADIICDTLANGFKIRTTAGNINTNAGTFVYACFAENPFQYARAR